jgi:somatic embryogenesis receptor kinase 1
MSANDLAGTFGFANDLIALKELNVFAHATWDRLIAYLDDSPQHHACDALEKPSNFVCDRDLHITGLQLSGILLNGTLPESIGLMEHLQSIDVHDNALDTILFAPQATLQSINFRNNNFANLPWNAELPTALTFLDLSVNSFTGTLPFRVTEWFNANQNVELYLVASGFCGSLVATDGPLPACPAPPPASPPPPFKPPAPPSPPSTTPGFWAVWWHDALIGGGAGLLIALIVILAVVLTRRKKAKRRQAPA